MVWSLVGVDNKRDADQGFMNLVDRGQPRTRRHTRFTRRFRLIHLRLRDLSSPFTLSILVCHVLSCLVNWKVFSDTLEK